MNIEASAFDARHYALPIARLIRETHDDGSAIEAALARARAGGYAVAFLRLAGHDPLVDSLAAAGHAPVDTLVTSTLDRARTRPPANAGGADVTIEHHPRLEHPGDVAAVVAATAAFRRSHLYADPRLPQARTHALYAEWATNDVTGRAGRVIVARWRGAIVGYITVLDGPSRVIDLVAVHPEHQGRGIGAALVGATTEWLASESIPATVGTQVDNPALALYARHGFVPTASDVTFHLWLDGANA